MLNRIKDLINQHIDFAFETTLATKSHVKYIQEAQTKGYAVTLVYFRLSTPELAVERVKKELSRVDIIFLKMSFIGVILPGFITFQKCTFQSAIFG